MKIGLENSKKEISFMIQNTLSELEQEGRKRKRDRYDQVIYLVVTTIIQSQ